MLGLSLLAFGLGFGSSASASDLIEAGRDLHQQNNCYTCHGDVGVSMAPDQFPHLAGQYASYLTHTLKGYRDGSRVNAMMNPLAANLSDREIRALAAFYAAQDGLVTAPTERLLRRP